MEKKPQKRIEEIDALRGLAAVMVLSSHYSRIYGPHHNLVGFYFPIGYYGIYLFFAISGFVILLTLHRCRTGLDFAVSRFSRIFPAYWTAATITFLVTRWLGPTPAPTFPQLAINFTMLDRVLGYPHIDEVYWTLNVELSFYLWMLLYFSLAPLNRVQRVIPFVLLFQAAVAVFCHVTGHTFSQGIKVMFLLEYAHLFCAGIIFYEAWEHGFSRTMALLLGGCLVNQALIPFREFPWMPPDWWGIIAVALVFVIMYLVVRGHLRWLVSPFFLFLGTISYPLYLVHNEIGKSLLAVMADHGFSRGLGTVVAVVAAFSLATLINLVVEKPAMKWIRNRYRAWQNQPATKASAG